MVGGMMRDNKIKAKKWMILIFLVLSVIVGVILWTLNFEKTIPIGFPNQTVSFGMSVSEVVSEAGIPDRKHEEDGIRSCKYVYTNIDILGYTGSIVYIFNNHEENENAKVITAYLTLKDESQTKCDKMMDDLQNYFENLFCDEPGFQVEVDEEVHRIGVESPIEERLISTSVRVIRITQVNGIINVETYPKA